MHLIPAQGGNGSWNSTPNLFIITTKIAMREMMGETADREGAGAEGRQNGTQPENANSFKECFRINPAKRLLESDQYKALRACPDSKFMVISDNVKKEKTPMPQST